MAISIIEYQLIRTLREQGLLPLGGDLMEIGEANWYGDVGPDVLRADIERFAAPSLRPSLLAGLEKIAAAPDGLRGWDMARIFWHTFLQPGSLSAIDLHGSRNARKLDLNQPLQLGHQFHVVHNNGTLEHIFDIAQGFRNMHEMTRPGGLMIHHAPFVGWVDHGFYGLHPTLFWDIAEANGYHMVALVYAEIDPPRLETLPSREAVLALAPTMGRNGNLAAVMQRPLEALPFRIPMQGYYAGKVSQKAIEAWDALR